MRRATRSRSTNWLATHERTARPGGALFSPRVRPALRRADPVARRAPARPRRGRRSSRARAGPANLVSARRAGRPGRLALPHRPQPGNRRAAAGANPCPGVAAPGRRRRARIVAARSAFRRRDRRRIASPALRLLPRCGCRPNPASPSRCGRSAVSAPRRSPARCSPPTPTSRSGSSEREIVCVSWEGMLGFGIGHWDFICQHNRAQVVELLGEIIEKTVMLAE